MAKPSGIFKVPEIIQSHRFAIIYVGPLAPPKDVFNHFAQQHSAATAWVTQGDITASYRNLAGNEVRDWVHQRQLELGLTESAYVISGYYLFIDNKARLYHSVLIDIDNDILSLVSAAATGVPSMLIGTENPLRVAFDVAQQQAISRVIAAFEEAIAESMRCEPQQPRALHVSDTSLDIHFGVLGLKTSSELQTIKRRYRELMQQWHPDKFASNPTMQKIATTNAQNINIAYEFIMTQRGWHVDPVGDSATNP